MIKIIRRIIQALKVSAAERKIKAQNQKMDEYNAHLADIARRKVWLQHKMEYEVNEAKLKIQRLDYEYNKTEKELNELIAQHNYETYYHEKMVKPMTNDKELIITLNKGEAR